MACSGDRVARWPGDFRYCHLQRKQCHTEILAHGYCGACWRRAHLPLRAMGLFCSYSATTDRTTAVFIRSRSGQSPQGILVGDPREQRAATPASNGGQVVAGGNGDDYAGWRAFSAFPNVTNPDPSGNQHFSGYCRESCFYERRIDDSTTLVYAYGDVSTTMLQHDADPARGFRDFELCAPCSTIRADFCQVFRLQALDATPYLQCACTHALPRMPRSAAPQGRSHSLCIRIWLSAQCEQPAGRALPQVCSQ